MPYCYRRFSCGSNDDDSSLIAPDRKSYRQLNPSDWESVLWKLTRENQHRGNRSREVAYQIYPPHSRNCPKLGNIKLRTPFYRQHLTRSRLVPMQSSTSCAQTFLCTLKRNFRKMFEIYSQQRKVGVRWYNIICLVIFNYIYPFRSVASPERWGVDY